MRVFFLHAYGQLVGLFAVVTVFFFVASELTSGTRFIDVFNIGKAVVLIIFLVVALEAGS